MPKTRSIFPVETAEVDERLYFEMINTALEARENKLISNGKPAHAVYLLNKFLASAERSVRIYTGKLSRVFDGVLAYGDPQLARSAIQFLQKENSSLSIMIAEDPDVEEGQSIEDHPLLAAISKAAIRGSVNVSRGNPDDLEGFNYHFIVMDEEAARVEYDTDKVQAFVNFGYSETGARLARLFDAYQRNSTPLLSLPAAA